MKYNKNKMSYNLDDCGGATDFIAEHAEECILDDLDNFVEKHLDAILESLERVKKSLDKRNIEICENCKNPTQRSNLCFVKTERGSETWCMKCTEEQTNFLNLI